MTQTQADPYLDQLFNAVNTTGGPDDEPEEEPLFLGDLPQMMTANDVTPELLADFRRRFPKLRSDSDQVAREIIADHKNTNGSAIRATPPESAFQSTIRAPGRILGGFKRGAIIEPAIAIDHAFAALAAAAGNSELADAFRSDARRIERQNRGVGTEGGLATGVGNVVGSILPSAASMLVSGGSTGIVLAYYGVQAFGSGAEDYRVTMEARGLEPDAIDAVVIGVGYGAVEVAAEKLGLDIIGKKIGPAIARDIGDKILKGRIREASTILIRLEIASDVEGIEEVLTQFVQNAIAQQGIPGLVDAFDPSRPLHGGTLDAFLMGKAGGGILGISSAFSPRGRAIIRGEEVPAPTTGESELTEALEDLTPAQRAEVSTVLETMAKEELTDAQAAKVDRGKESIAQMNAEEGVTPDELDAANIEPIEEGDVDPTEAASEEIASSTPSQVEELVRASILKPGQRRSARSRQALRQEAVRVQQRVAETAEVTKQQQAAAELRDALTANRVELQDPQRARSIDQIKGEVITAIKDGASEAVPAKVLTTIGQATTVGQLAKGIRQIRQHLDEFERNQAHQSLESTLSHVKPQQLRPQFREAVESLLANIRVVGLSGKQEHALQRLKEFLDANPDAQVRGELHTQLAELTKTNAAELDTQEARDLTQALNSILHVNNTLNRLHSREGQRTKHRNIALIAKELTAAETVQGRPVSEATGEQERGKIANIPRLMVGLEENAMLDTLAEWLGGSSRSHTVRILYKNIADGQRDAFEDHQTAIDRLEEVITERAGIELGSRELAQMSGEIAKQHGVIGAVSRLLGMNQKDTAADIHEVQLSGGRTIQLDSAQRMHVLALLMDQETHDLIMFDEVPIHISGQPSTSTFVLSAEDVQAIRQSATPAETTIVKGAMEHINGEMKEAMRGWSLNKVGVDITKRETYMPRRRVRTTQEVKVDATTMGEVTLDSAGITKERQEDLTSPIAVGDFFLEYYNLSWATYSIAHMEKPVRRASEVLSSRNVHRILSDSTRSRSLNRFRQAYDLVAQETVGGRTLRGPLSDAAGPLNRAVTLGLLGINWGVGLKQVASVVVASVHMRSRDLTSAIRRGAFLDPGVTQRIKENSPRLRDRMENSAMGLINEGQLGGRNLLGFKGKGEVVMFFIRLFDQMAIKTIWRGAELQAKREGSTGQALLDRAAEISELVVNRTQPTFDALHISGKAVEARKSATAKFFTFFRAQRSKNIDMTARAAIRMQRGTASDRVRETSNLAKIWVGQTLAIIGATELKRLILKGFDDEDEGNWIQRVMMDFISVAAGNVLFGDFLAGIFKSAAQEGAIALELTDERMPLFTPDVSPVQSLAEELVESGVSLTRVAQTKDDADKIFDGLEAFATLMALRGIPFLSPLRDVKNIYNRVFDEDPGDTDHF